METNVRRKLIAGSVTLEHLPEMPGYNGSVSMIDSTEALEIANDIDSAVVMIDELIAAAKYAKEVLGILWVSHHANRTDAAIQQIDAAIAKVTWSQP